MKKDIHPKYNQDCKVSCACGRTFTTGSTVTEIRVELCNQCHPFYTGKQKFVDTARRVEKFEQRAEKKNAIAIERKGKKVKKAAVAAKKEVDEKKAAKSVSKKKPSPKKSVKLDSQKKPTKKNKSVKVSTKKKQSAK
ncbi:MAG: 50S ribosomal protein L31 [bacterium]